MSIRVFVGCAANHEDAESQAVLEYSIRKNTQADVEITWMKLSKDPESPFYSDYEKHLGWDTSRWATPFSGFRFAIPFLCDFSGKAIYTDSDVIFMADIVDLWTQEFQPGKVVMAKGGTSGRLCVSLWNCLEARKYLPRFDQLQRDPEAFRKVHTSLKTQSRLIQATLGNWNCLDGEQYIDLHDPEIKAIHYTSMPHQVHLPSALRRLKEKGVPHWFQGQVQPHWRKDLIELFTDLLNHATTSGYPVSKYEQDPLYGPYQKATTAGRNAAIPVWGKR
jgi:hypothetical protein